MSCPQAIDRGCQSITEVYADLRQDYKASKTTRFQRTRRGIKATGTSGDYHLGSDRDYFFVVELCRDLERNNPVISQAVRRLVANVVQDGFGLDPNTGDDVLDADLKSLWSEWSTDPDQVSVCQEMDWHALEKLALYQVLCDGDLAILPTRRGQLEVLESHRLRSPRTTKNVVHGVLLDQFRKRLAYYFTKESIDPMRATANIKVADMRQIPAPDKNGFRQVFHLYNPKRWTQTRGVSALQPVVDFVGMLDDIQFARLVQQQAVSAWCILREREAGFVRNRNETGASDSDALPSILDGTLKGVAAGMEVSAPPGEKISGFSPNVPNPQFFDHTNLILNIISVNIDLPVAVFMLDPSKTNFSGWRGAIDQARLGWKWWQQWYCNRLHRPTYLWKLRQWIAGDAVLAAAARRSDVNIFKHGWHRPRWAYIEPLKDASADLLRDRNGMTSKRRLHAERSGVEWSDLAREIVEDNALAIRLAKATAAAINAEFEADPVHWREVMSLPTPDGTQVNLLAQDNSQAAQDGEAQREQ